MKKETKVVCPACGSDRIRSTESEAQLSLPFSDTVKYSQVNHICEVCGTEGDFANSNEAAINKAIEAAETSSAPKMIDFLSANGHTMASTERALGLSPRTMLRWKAGDISAPSLALLRYLRAFPWLIEVAENKFNPIAVHKILGHQLVQYAAGLLERSQCFADIRISSLGGSKIVATNSGYTLESPSTTEESHISVAYEGGLR